jgi:hypothetical protein
MLDLSYFNITDYLDNKGIYYRTEGKNIQDGWIGIDCPFCPDPDKGQHLGISPTMGLSCWRCGTTGNIYTLLKFLEKGTRPSDIIKEYSSKIIKLQTKTNKKTGIHHLSLPESFSKNFTPEFKNFLITRKYDPEKVIKKYNLYIDNFCGDYAYRIIIPFYLNKQLVTWIGRDYTNEAYLKEKPLEINKAVIHSSHILYNLKHMGDIAVVVEGIFDVWRIGDGAVSTQGTQYTLEQLQYLKKCKKVFVLFDAGKNEQESAKKLTADLLTIIPDVERLDLSEGDPDDLSEDDVKSLRKMIFTKIY